MEYQKRANLLENTSNKPSKFRARNWVEINDDSRGTYTDADIKFKSTMLKSNLCVKWKITITGAGDNAAAGLADEDDRISHSIYYLPKVEIKGYNVMIDGRNFFNQPIKNMNKTYENIRKIATGKGNDHTTGCLLDYPYLKDHYKMITIDLSKQQALDADPRKIQQINFTANFDRAGNTTTLFIIDQEKETIFEFSQGTVKVL